MMASTAVVLSAHTFQKLETGVGAYPYILLVICSPDSKRDGLRMVATIYRGFDTFFSSKKAC